MKKVTIRPARSSELAVLKRFEQGIISAERPYDHMLKPDPISYYDIDDLIQSPDAEVAVAAYEEQLIGSGYVKKKRSRHYVSPDYHAFIGFLYVEPEYRGQGVNRKILDYLFAWARANKLPEVHLTVYPDNDAALRAYGKMGFRPYLTEMRVNLND